MRMMRDGDGGLRERDLGVTWSAGRYSEMVGLRFRNALKCTSSLSCEDAIIVISWPN